MNREDGNPHARARSIETRRFQDALEAAERVARIISQIAIPVVIAIAGWGIQTTLAQRSVNKDYVELAVSILTRPTDTAPLALRSWAVDLLDYNSPVKLNPTAVVGLKSGDLSLPPISQSGQTTTYNCAGNAPAIDAIGFSPASPAFVGTPVTIHAKLLWSQCFRSLRLKIDGSVIYEVGTPESSFTWDTSTYGAGNHIIRLEASTIGDPSWAEPSSQEAIYRLEEPAGARPQSP